MSDGGGLAFGLFGLFFVFIFLVAVAPLFLGIFSIVSILTTPEPAFGPWWDNTRMTWFLGILVSFVIPFGGVIAGIMWITTGRKGVRQRGLAGRPFWAGNPKPPPYLGPYGQGPDGQGPDGQGPYGQGPYGQGPYPGPPQSPPPGPDRPPPPSY